MEVASCKNSPNFQAKLVAKVVSPKNEFEIFELDKVLDKEALTKLNDSFTKENILQRFPDEGLLSVTLNFIKNAFNSIDNPNTRAFLSVADGKPSGIMTLKTSLPDKYICVDYLAAWKPDNVNKPSNNGRALIRHLFEIAKQHKTETIDLTPGFKSDNFYAKLGFKKDGFDVAIDQDGVSKSIKNIDKVLKYEKIDNQPNIDLNV